MNPRAQLLLGCALWAVLFLVGLCTVGGCGRFTRARGEPPLPSVHQDERGRR